MNALTNVFSAFGLSSAAGLNAYLPLLVVALTARFTNLIQLNEPWDVMTSWWVIGALAILLLLEMTVDKIPAVDTVNDGIHTFIRPVAGAILFAASANVINDVTPVLSVILGLLISGGVHTAKALARPVVTTTTVGLGNPVVSTVEDVVSGVTALLAVLLPWLALIIATSGIVLFLWWRMRRAERRSARP